MSNENSLLHFLSAYPWTSKNNLELIFGKNFPQLAESDQIRFVSVPDIGECWGLDQECISTIPGIRRREIAKFYILRNYGKDALWIGGSPGLWGSDLLVYTGKDRKFWIRVWVDHGGANVDTLPYIHHEPDRIAPNLVDVILTTSIIRAELIKLQISSHWEEGTSNVLIYAEKQKQYLRLQNYHHHRKVNASRKPLQREKILALLEDLKTSRLDHNEENKVLAKLFLSLHQIDFELLSFLGDNPLFGINEISYLVSHAATGARLAGSTQIEVMIKAKKMYQNLKKLGLITKISPDQPDYKLSKMGLNVLAKFWGIHQEAMRRFQSWPQKKNGQGQTHYSENALTYREKHTREVQRFVFGMLDNAWRRSKPYGGLDIYLDTIVGKRIYFQDLATGKYDWVVPDAVIELGFWQKIWKDGSIQGPKNRYCKVQLLLEFDRATSSIPRLQERITNYGLIWKNLPGNPVQIWVIDGTPWREKEILRMMREAGVNGWTVLLERLRLEKNDPWWETHFQFEGTLPYQKHQGFAPLRKIWRNTQDYQLHHFLDQTPWTQQMTHSKPIIKIPRGY